MKTSKLARVAALLVAVIMVLAMAGVASAAAKPKLKIAMVTDTGGLGDQSFNDAAYAGLKRVQSSLKCDIKVIESKKMEDYVANLTTLANEKYDMIWAIGFLMVDAVTQVAAKYPETKFGIIDSTVDAPNVLSVTFKENEGSFLQGVVAGMATKTNKVGFVGGMEAPIIIKFEAGFVAGVKAANPKAEVLIAYTGSFSDAVKGKELALTQYGQGADVVYHASGACGLGVFEAAKEKNLLAIGVDSDQTRLDPTHIISSMLKGVGEGVFAGTKTLVDKKFKAGHLELGLKEKGVSAAFSASVDEKLSAKKLKDIKKKVDGYTTQIVKGKISVPATREELKK